MNRILLLMTLVVILVCPRLAHSQGAVQAWIQRYNGPVNGDDIARAVAADTNGNVLVTGYSASSGGGNDYVTIKYSGAGMPLWTNRYNGPGNGDDFPYAMAVDTNGNVFVTGESLGNSNSADFATIKYSGAGVPLWTNRYNGKMNGLDGAFALALDTNGNAFVTGHSDVNGGTGGALDYVTIKYSGAGVSLWTNYYNGPANGSDAALALAVDLSGNVLVTGISSFDWATIKYSNAGVPLWTNRYNDKIDYTRAVAVDTNGNVFVTGNSYTNGPDADCVTIKYSGAGMPLWTNRYNGPGNDTDAANAIAVDSNGNVLITGFSYANPTNSDYLTIKYSGAGVPLWTNLYIGPGNGPDEAHAVAVDTNGNIFVTGLSSASSSNFFYDYATIAYSGAGVPLWTNRADGPKDNSFLQGATVAVDGRGNVIVAGSSPGIGSGFDYMVTQISPAPPSLTATRTTTNTVAISWPSPSTGFTLQQNTNGIATTNWNNVLTAPTDNGTTKTVIVNPPTGTRFYRLSSP